jgi:hypothetical protein
MQLTSNQKENYFYNKLTAIRQDSDPLKKCIEQTVQKLVENDTDANKPGMLLGKIQSGKTRAFIGVIALSFDHGYDIAIILTKGTKVLALQTHNRLNKDFSEFVEDDLVQVRDIMHLPNNLVKYELNQKQIIVVKKQTHNLDRIIKALTETYPNLSQKKILIIDDEADYASIGFKKKREDIVDINKIAGQIDELRKKSLKSDFLQVTATPYSLYLQPEELEIKPRDQLFKPIRPTFTVLLPVYSGYIGGDYFFRESDNNNSVAYYIYEEVSKDELIILKKEDKRRFKKEEALTSPAIKSLRRAIVNFIVGACIRRIQQRIANQKIKKYSFIVHTEQARKAHSWQEEIVHTLKDLLISCLDKDKMALLDELVKEAYNNLIQSINITKLYSPNYKEVQREVYTSLQDDYLMITKVNSDKDVEELLDDNGQLKLRTPLNIFIGGQILDRGITIDNLIGFYYGRKPNKFQQDTVLQHSRMFGNRPKEDIAVTRFYTVFDIYEAMERINELDSALRHEIEKGIQGNGVAFIHKDSLNRIRPCSPNKILLSTTTTLVPHKRLVPVGFQTRRKTHIQKTIKEIDRIIKELKSDHKNPLLIDLDIAKNIIDLINSSIVNFECSWDVNAFKASMEYLSKNTSNLDHKDKLWCLTRIDRNISRKKQDGTFSSTPDNPETDQIKAKECAKDIPILMLFKQNGSDDRGWMGCPFWWPVLMAPKSTQTVIFASNLQD